MNLTFTRKTVRYLTLAAAGLLIVIAVVVYGVGLVTVERHRGFFAPAWGPSGTHVYFIQRDTFGITWGMGWEHFSPPASAYAIRDEIRLQRLDRKTGAVETLQLWNTTPIKGRVVKEFRGRIFNFMRARVRPEQDAVEFRVAMAIPRVPRSEQHSLKGRWNSGQPSDAVWRNEWGGMTGYVEEVLVNGRELLTVRGNEAYPAAIVETSPNGEYAVLLKNEDFRSLYPDGIPQKLLAERARRPMIERARKMRLVKRELIETYKAEGLRENDAHLKALDRMEELGYFPRSSRLTAKRLSGRPSQRPVFEISPMEFRVGLFTDIHAAISEPGKAVKKSMGRYVIHRDYDTSKRLNDWLKAGNKSFVVGHEGNYYEMQFTQ